MNMSSCLPEAEPDFCATIVSNPDISGRGVRYAIYTQTIISMLVASFIPYHEKAFRDSSRNTLFDALIVTMLTTMMTAFVTVNAPFIRILGLSINISSFLFTTFWCYWGVQVWQDPSTFGIPRDGENCTASTSTVVVVFGQNVSVANSHLRGFALAMFGIGTITAFASLYYSTIWWARYAVNGSSISKEAAARKYIKELRRKKKKEHVSRFGGMAGVIYLIVTVEQMVDRNNVKDQLSDWTYSQTIALIMLLQQLMDCTTYFKEEYQHWKERAQIRKNQDRRLRAVSQARTSPV